MPLELNEAIAAALAANQGLATNYDVRLSHSSAGDAAVLADPDRLAQVLTNLLSNAIKFSPAGGEVRVELRSGADRHRISVCDSGPGIPEEFRNRMFEKFAQADSSDARQLGGTGLGLSIVREIVERLGGAISFDCPPEGGTRFHVDLPALAQRPAPVAAGRAQVLLCGSTAVEALQRRLVAAGQEAEVAPTLDLAHKALSSRTFAAIVIDLAMVGGAGVSLIQAARASAMNSGTPVLAMGGEPAGEDLAGYAALVADWIEKPVSAEDMAQAVSRAIAGAEQAQPRVLHVDDDPDVLQVVAGALEGTARLTSAASLQEARRLLQQQHFDLVILDLTLRA